MSSDAGVWLGPVGTLSGYVGCVVALRFPLRSFTLFVLGLWLGVWGVEFYLTGTFGGLSYI